MGIFSSKYDAPYKYFGLSEHREVFNQLKLKDSEVGKIYKSFQAIDADESKTVNINEIFIHLHIEKTFFNRRVFSILDADGSGDLDFGEFLVGLWNYCSIDNKFFGAFNSVLQSFSICF
jgi:Ca2+-binding EF-hand superfamily protein